MAAVDYDWDNTELSDEESRLIRAYAEVGRPLDALPYTEDFDQLVSLAKLDDTLSSKNQAFKILLNLRKRGRLPRHVHVE